MNSNLTVRIDQHIKELASANAKQLGLDLSTIIRMLLTQLAAKGTLPEGLVEPNSETLQAIYELENGIGVSHYNSVEDLKADLGW
ncbi:type II toxin-antitoxin system RelB/DinJ family antitoxin [Gallibacterium anatis]|uniref:Type II toxin-antitoxin system RelB/DinJ family antitoxin n=1 Tax=Gallibacterium anatis TaxID=750 RepID=A0AAX3XBR9_9PAST|nr:type II toxin-antitoxin system RelB/DinJ family antitoxin [Gallibacterium anatis]MDK9431437.1 type II toxin-antitoxin system RelB/DinJ family antitoxin [Gallibacterium anatis]WIM78499.1 type II toxin-antitoxin system RelB/DinJ family antitoxin [Gallibacterium anatis]